MAWKNVLTHSLSLEALPFHMIGLLCFVGSEIATVLSDHSRGFFFQVKQGHWQEFMPTVLEEQKNLMLRSWKRRENLTVSALTTNSSN